MFGNRASVRYAKALLDLSIELNFVDKAKEDMLSIQSALKQHSEFRVVLGNPIVKQTKKYAIIDALYSGSFHKNTLAFLALLISKGRADILVDIIDSFIQLHNQKNGIVNASVVSATELSDAVLKNITKIVSGATSASQVVLDNKVNEDLVGGFVLTVGDRQIDASVSGGLSKLKRILV